MTSIWDLHRLNEQVRVSIFQGSDLAERWVRGIEHCHPWWRGDCFATLAVSYGENFMGETELRGGIRNDGPRVNQKEAVLAHRFP